MASDDTQSPILHQTQLKQFSIFFHKSLLETSPLENIQLKTGWHPMFSFERRNMSLTRCQPGLGAHPIANTENETTTSIFTCFPEMIAWKTCPTLYRIQIYKSTHVLFSETSNTAQNMSFLLLKTRMHKHWTGDNCINFHLLPTNDVSKHIPCKTYQSNLQERPRSFWRS